MFLTSYLILYYLCFGCAPQFCLETLYFLHTAVWDMLSKSWNTKDLEQGYQCYESSKTFDFRWNKFFKIYAFT